MQELLRHYFFPHHTNNHRARLLHHQFLFAAVLFFFVGSFFVSYAKLHYPSVLGASIEISAEDLLNYTNQKRVELGQEPLVLNDQLSSAASEKAKHMFQYDYWAHNAPNGTTPWVFVKGSGYSYVYAGENLARGFNDSSAVVDAWMASPTHRENMLSKNYQDIGFAIVSGKLNGEDTILVVEMFGGKKPGLTYSTPSVPVETASANKFSFVLSKSVIDSDFWTKNISLIVLGLFIAALVLDMVTAHRKKIIRVVGHNIDHILFLSVIAIFLLLISQGVVA